eukprot:TRINITY_DN6456_c0_g1_i6.p1 TRINITY_DN6456_c0_g1~~TRINITY_DN6456_c0_g1_i6.p1  ORF type:complete len:1112 (+),score=393.75 TRINITY_DN6456_c0_g1_i6:120-3455(+)
MQADRNLTPEQEAELKKEIEQFRSLKKIRMGSSDDISKMAYVVSKQWLKKWKHYTGTPKKRHFAYYDNETNLERKHPGPITNKEIIDETKDFYKSSDLEDIYNTILKPEMREHFEYRIINEGQWNLLFGKYGGVAVKREKFRDEYSSFMKVEVYFHRLNLIVLPDRDDFDLRKISLEKSLFCSKRWNLGRVRERITNVLTDQRYGFKFELEKFRLWKLEPSGNLQSALNQAAEALKKTPEPSNSDDVEINSGVEFPGVPLDIYGKNAVINKLELALNDRIIIELPNQKGEYVFKYRKNLEIKKCEFCYNKRPILVSCKCGDVHYCSQRCKVKDEVYHRDKCTAIDIDEELSKYQKTANSNMGLTGLQNLGNTCFMNSGLQCLSNTWQLSKYFLTDLYLPEINTENKLGMRGKMAHSFAKLIKALWYDSERSVAPWDLKKVLGKQYTTFCGFSQQDSQELISAVLDALHEDLNRVKIKPYVEQKTTDDPNDDSAKDPSWYNFLARNRSIIVDLFYGQYKSILQCPLCYKYSITFDPFSVVSLPVPQDTKTRLIVTYVPYSMKKKLIRTVMAMERDASVDELREQLVETFGVKKYGSLLSIIAGRSLERLVGRNERVGTIGKYQEKNAHLFVQEINPKYFDGAENVGVREKMEEEKKVKKAVNMYGETIESLVSREDYNNGLADDLIKFPLNICGIDRSWSIPKRDVKTFTRVLYTKKSCTLKQLHLEIFAFLRPLFEEELVHRESPYEESKEIPSKKQVEYSSMSDEALFGKVFAGMNEENWKKTVMTSKELPYVLNFVNVRDYDSYSKKKCYYCNEYDCGNCPVPFTSEITVGDMAGKLEGKKESLYSDRLYHDPKCFKLEVILNKNDDKAIISKSNFEPVEAVKMKAGTAKTELSIYDCLDSFVEWETLDKDNLWYCPFCKDSVAAKKKFEFTRAPPVLVLHLKRFKTSSRGRFMGSDRLNNLIDFPLTDLDFTRYLKGASSPVLYDLYAVSNHYGSTGFGHYTAFAWNQERKGWYQFDDSRVSSEDARKVCSTAAYVLFYKRKDIAESVDFAGIRQEIPEGYKVPVVELSKGNKPKGDNDVMNTMSSERDGMADGKVNNTTLNNKNRNN